MNEPDADDFDPVVNAMSAILNPNGPEAAGLNAINAARRAAQQSAVPAPIDPKVIATLQARAAMLGLTLVRSTDGGVFTAMQGPWSRTLDSVAAVGEFLDRIEGRRP
jgi:hypothetical protein